MEWALLTEWVNSGFFLPLSIGSFVDSLIDRLSSHIYLAPGKGAKYCDEYVCLSVRSHILETMQSNLTIFMLVACDRGSVLLWRRCDTLCTSGFMDDVMFSHNALNDASRARQAAKTTASVPTKFCSPIKSRNYTSCVARRGRSLISAITLLTVCLDVRRARAGSR